MKSHKFIFIGGLHRSGTSTLFKCIREHPLISGFRDTGVPEDEGQHLQSVYPPAKFFGGPGRFGFKSEAHLTEASPLVSEENRIRLFSEWKRYWNTEKPFLLEKSPPNLIRARFLQAMFPNSYFIMLVRHPVAVSYATRKWSKTATCSLIKHWLTCHEIFNADRSYLVNLFVLKYEDFVRSPHFYLDKIFSFLGIDNYSTTLEVRSDINRKYFERWRKYKYNILSRFYRYFLLMRFEKRVNRFSYSLYDLELTN